MLYTGFFKRIIPFVLTFAAGLFIASFFVSIAAPSFSKWRESRRSNRCRDRHELRMQIDDLREELRSASEELRSVRSENELLKRQATDDAFKTEWQVAVPPVVTDAHPPTPPKRPKQPRTEILQ